MSGTTATQTAFSYQRQNFKNRGIEDVPIDEDAPRRRSASNYAAAFNALTKISGIKPDFWNGLHILLDKTQGSAPGDCVEFNNTGAGALLPGDDDVSDDAKARRWKRFWCGYDTKEAHYDGFEDEQRRLGKRIAYREPGKTVKQTKFDEPKLIPSRYKSSLAQMMVDIVRRASELKDKRIQGKKLTRKQRFEEAAKITWNLLPDYDETSKIKIKGDSKQHGKPTKNRCMDRILKAAKEMIALAESEEEIERLRMNLHAELETLFADATSVENEPEETQKSDENSHNRATFFGKNCKNIEQNEDFSESRGDKVVTPETEFDAEEIPPELVAIGVIEWRDGGRSGRMK